MRQARHVCGGMILLRLLIICVLLAGCSKPSAWDRVALQGSVTVDGQPFDGSIALKPHQGNRGPSATTKVSKGEFKFSKHDGPVAGANQAILMFASGPDQPEQSYAQSTTVPDSAPFRIEFAFATPEAEADESGPSGTAVAPVTK